MSTLASHGIAHESLSRGEVEAEGAPGAASRDKTGSERRGGGRTELDKSGSAIQEMFAGVAPRYDLLNRLLSGRRDVAWRRQAALALALPAGSRVLDLCCGTGDQALAVGRLGYRVVAADFCLPMLALAQRKYARRRENGDDGTPRGTGADSLRLPFADASFDGATASFGLRNLADLDAGLAEIARVLKPTGRVSFLEAAVPRNRLRRPYLWYFTRVLPRIGRLLSPRGSAYSYLPDSVLEFPEREGFVDLMERAGLICGRWRDLSAGAVCLYTGHKKRAGDEHEQLETRETDA